MKKLRALLRLVRGELGDARFAPENACFRDTAAELPGVRDADVMLATLDALDLAALRRSCARRLAGCARRWWRTASARRGLASRGAVAIAARGARAGGATGRSSATGSRRSRRACGAATARDARATARRRSSRPPRHMHEWRKRVKDLWYHVRCSRDWKPVMSALADEAHELSDASATITTSRCWPRGPREHAGREPSGFEAVGSRRAELQAEAFDSGRGCTPTSRAVYVRSILRRLWNTSADIC